MLLLRKKLAVPLLILSFIAVIAQQLYMFVLSDIGKSMSSGQLSMTISIPIIAVFLVWFAKSSAGRGWLK